MTRLIQTTLIIAILMVPFMLPTIAKAQSSEQSGSVGVEGRISSPPPTTGATITSPSNGQTFSEVPITVSGLCSDDLLIKLFKNNVFAGSAQCDNGSYSIVTDLFSGDNELVARVFDELDQAGPDSNTVSVVFDNPAPGGIARPTLTSSFAKRGANPGQTLTWPVSLSGGQGPYAMSVDWGDGTPPDLFTIGLPGEFDIEHVYDNPGVYNVVVRATDNNDTAAFLQLVGVANGPLSQTDADAAGEGQATAAARTRILWQPAAILIPFIFSTFWLGKKYQLHSIRSKIERGERPF
ncbi:MAG: hypothetical protein U5K77_03160 [Candidatus Saccharibacteria bacterium]|nr:hypothetical protein [Candidatus Saccharibacteria bacterium]